MGRKHSEVAAIVGGILLGGVLCWFGATESYEFYRSRKRYSVPPLQIDLRRGEDEIRFEENAWVELRGYRPFCELGLRRPERSGGNFLPITDPAGKVLIVLEDDQGIHCDPTGERPLSGTLERSDGTLREYRQLAGRYEVGHTYYLCGWCGPYNNTLGLLVFPAMFLGGIIILVGSAVLIKDKFA
jgi:hypothetical protein